MIKGFGTIVNVSAIIITGVAGLLIGRKISNKIHTAIMNIIGLFSLIIGIQMALQTENIIIILVSLTVGTLIGEIIRIEEKIQDIGKSLEKKYHDEEKGEFVKAFLTSTILFCVGPLAILGPIQDVIKDDYSLLLMKSFLDGFTTLILSSVFGIGALFSAIPVFVYQGSVSLFASFMQRAMTEAVIAELTACGGLMIISSGMSILGIKKFKTANMLPALMIAPVVVLILEAVF